MPPVPPKRNAPGGAAAANRGSVADAAADEGAIDAAKRGSDGPAAAAAAGRCGCTASAGVVGSSGATAAADVEGSGRARRLRRSTLLGSDPSPLPPAGRGAAAAWTGAVAGGGAL